MPWSTLRRLLRREPTAEVDSERKALVLLPEVKDVFKAERVLKKEGYAARPVAPPPEHRTGCDLAVEIDVMEQLGIERLLLDEQLEPLDVVPVNGSTERPVEVVDLTDFGGMQWSAPGT